MRSVSTLLLALGLAASSAGVTPTGETSTPERQTMDALRALAGALLSRMSDEMSAENRLHGLPAELVLVSQPSNLLRMPPASARRSLTELHELLRPREDFIYLCDIPERDAWGTRIEAYYDQEHILSGRVVTVRSAGANRRFDSDVYEVGGFLPGSQNDDIVIFDKRFVRWPLGVTEAELRVEEKIGRCPGFDDGSAQQAP